MGPLDEDPDMKTKREQKRIVEEVKPKEIIQTSQVAPLSDQYIGHTIANLITSIKEELKLWKAYGTEDSLPQISKIKELLDQQSSYMVGDPYNEVLLGYLELIFTNNNWVGMQESQIGNLIVELGRFETGNVTVKDLRNFSKQLFQSGISTLKYEEEKAQEAKINEIIDYLENQ